MDPIDQLPPDQSAVLSLLLRQGRSYADIANLLGIPQRAVRDRAHAALDAIAGDPAEQHPAAARGAASAATRTPTAAAAPRSSRVPGPPEVHPPTPHRRRSAPTPGGSRRAGALLLGAILAVIALAVILIAGGGGGSHTGTSAGAGSTTSGGSRTSTAAGEPHIDKQLNLTSPDPASKSVGLVEVLSQGSHRAFFLAAEHLPPTSGFFYAAWLYNSPSNARVLGRGPSVGASGKMQAVGALPTDAASFHQMLITRETAARPSHPGPIVLSGAFSLH